MKKIKKYFEEFNDVRFQKCGFIKYKHSYIRIINGILQSFTLEICKRDSTCTVGFNIRPLCYNCPVYVDVGEYNLDRLFAETFNRGWKFEDKSTNGRKCFVEMLSALVDGYLMPIFNRCSNYENTFRELYELNQLIDLRYKEMLKLLDMDESVESWEKMILFDKKLYDLSLKVKKYDFAKKHQENMIENAKKTITDPEQSDVVKSNYLEELAFYEEHYERLRNGEFTFFDKYISDNENKMKVFLLKNYSEIVNSQCTPN